MKRDEYLSYVRNRSDRLASRSHSAGMTGWALVIAIVYLMWRIIPMYGEIKSDHILVQTAVLLYSFMLLSIVYSFLLFFASYEKVSTERFNIRVSKGGVFDGLPKIILPILYVPVIVSLILIPGDFVSTHGGYARIQSVLDITMVLILFAVFSVVFTFKDRFQGEKEYPITEAQFFSRKPYLIIIEKVSMIFMAFGNMYACFLVAEKIPAQYFNPVVSMAFNLSIVNVVIALLIMIDRSKKHLETMSELERDIIFHDLSDSEIKARIQEDIIGYEVGDWLNIKLENLRNKGRVLEHRFDGFDKFLQEIENIDPSYKHERCARLMKYRDELHDLMEDYISHLKPLNDWIRKFTDSIGEKMDNRVYNMLVKVLDEIGESGKKMVDKSGEVSAAIVELIKDCDE